MPALTRDLKILAKLLMPTRGRSHQERLEHFYKAQAEDYDFFRSKLLPGRARLMEMLRPEEAAEEKAKWLDIGAGTGQNLIFMGAESVRKFDEVLLVDLSPSLLDQARKRVRSLDLSNVRILEEDVSQLDATACYDLVTLSYSLTMIPEWFIALEQAKKALKPGGRIAVVDFYVSQKYASPGLVQHSPWTRILWPLLFNWDNVFLNPDHLPFLRHNFTTDFIHEGFHRLPFLPGSRIPYFIYIGRRVPPPRAINESND